MSDWRVIAAIIFFFMMVELVYSRLGKKKDRADEGSGVDNGDPRS